MRTKNQPRVEIDRNAKALEVEGLRVELATSRLDIVDEVTFSIQAGEVLGLVGESGSGKTTVGLAMLGHCRRGVRITSGQVRINGEDILKQPLDRLRRLRGRVVSYVAQDPSAALNPALRIKTQLTETLQVHGYGDSTTERQERLQEMLTEVLLPRDRSFLRRYPHELSGGQQQRVVLAMAFACRPRLIVLDEPTTGLDVSTQAHILETVRHLCRSHHVAALYVTHDLAVVAALAHGVAVMYAGRLVEVGRQRDIFHDAAHPYTRKLLQAVPDISGRYALVGIRGHAPMPGRRPEACFFAPRCDFAVERCRQEFPPTSTAAESHSVRCFRAGEVRALDLAVRTQAELPVRTDRNEEPLLSIRGLRSGYRETEVLHDVSLDVWAGECLALVGESGSGKTTLARCIIGLHQRSSGEVYLRGTRLPAQARARDRRSRREIQYIFQSPYSSLNPRKSVGQIIGQPLRIFFELGRHEREARIATALERVGLSRDLMGRHPDQLSGGERQRVAIARALVAEPSLLICDEITSSLDVSVQAEIVRLLEGLQREIHLGVLFVTHNLALIRSIAQDVAVMSEGRIVELANVVEALERPRADYTRALISQTPRLDFALDRLSGHERE
jgi:peptide/nickel transport system ATP-binding protein